MTALRPWWPALFVAALCLLAAWDAYADPHAAADAWSRDASKRAPDDIDEAHRVCLAAAEDYAVPEAVRERLCLGIVGHVSNESGFTARPTCRGAEWCNDFSTTAGWTQVVVGGHVARAWESAHPGETYPYFELAGSVRAMVWGVVRVHARCARASAERPWECLPLTRMSSWSVECPDVAEGWERWAVALHRWGVGPHERDFRTRTWVVDPVSVCDPEHPRCDCIDAPAAVGAGGMACTMRRALCAPSRYVARTVRR